MNYGRRIEVLEGRLQPVDHASMDDDDRRWYLGLSVSMCGEVVWQFAKLLASRRFSYEERFPPGARSGHVDDWKEVTSASERNRRIQAECERLVSLANIHGDDQAITEWVGTADREGWPVLAGPVFRMDRDGFEDMVARRRASIDVSRGCDMPGSGFWRRDHPEWRPSMSGEESIAFESALVEEADRLYDEWFSEVPA